MLVHNAHVPLEACRKNSLIGRDFLFCLLKSAYIFKKKYLLPAVRFLCVHILFFLLCIHTFCFKLAIWFCLPIAGHCRRINTLYVSQRVFKNCYSRLKVNINAHFSYIFWNKRDGVTELWTISVYFMSILFVSNPSAFQNPWFPKRKSFNNSW